MKETKRELILFLLLTFIISYGFGIVGLFKGGLEHFPVGKYLMYTPAIIVLILYLFVFKKPIFKNNDIGLKFKGWKYWFIAPITIFGITSLTFLISYIISPELMLDKEKIITSSNHFLDINNWTLSLAIIFLINVFIAPLINIFMFLGEEIGWRGFMTPRLLRLFNPFTAFLIAGFVWGIWHVFGIIMGLNYPNNPIIGSIMMILVVIPISIIFQYFYFISKSIFVPALAHGALNWTTTTYLMYVFNDKFDTLIYGPTGIVGVIIWWIFGIWFFMNFKTAYNNVHKKSAEIN